MRRAEVCPEPHPVRDALSDSARTRAVAIPLEDVYELMDEHTLDLMVDAPRIASHLSDVIGREMDLLVLFVEV
jgi:hypothetical protein